MLKETCAALIMQYLGHMPPPHEIVIIPKSLLEQHSIIEQGQARMCAALYHIQWRVDRKH